MYQAPNAPLSIGGVLDSGFKLFRECFTQVFLFAVVTSLATAPASYVAPYIAANGPSAGLVGGVYLGIAAIVIVTLVLTSAMIVRIDGVARGEDVSVGGALGIGARRAPAALGSGILLTLAILAIPCIALIALGAVGLSSPVAFGLAAVLLLIVPGSVIAVWLFFGPYAAIIDRLGPLTSLKYSRRDHARQLVANDGARHDHRDHPDGRLRGGRDRGDGGGHRESRGDCGGADAVVDPVRGLAAAVRGGHPAVVLAIPLDLLRPQVAPRRRRSRRADRRGRVISSSRFARSNALVAAAALGAAAAGFAQPLPDGVDECLTRIEQQRVAGAPDEALADAATGPRRLGDVCPELAGAIDEGPWGKALVDVVRRGPQQQRVRGAREPRRKLRAAAAAGP